MKIIAKSQGMTKTQLYNLMSPEEYTNMREKVGEVITIKQFSIHEETDQYNGTKKVLSVETNEGEIVVSASRSLVGEFEKLVAIFGAKAINEISIIESGTGSGSDVLSCRFTGLSTAL